MPDATRITPDLLLHAYRIGIYPMAESRDDPEIHWFEPKLRGIMPLERFHLSRSLAKSMRRGDWQLACDQDFPAVMEACAAREETWISDRIRALYAELYHLGHAHSVEIRDAAGDLVGGLYGVTLGAAFFGESMFSRRTDASKIALACLVHRLRAGGFTLLDMQLLTPHLASMGGIQIPRDRYQKLLRPAVAGRASFSPDGYCASPSSVAASLSAASGTSGASGGA